MLIVFPGCTAFKQRHHEKWGKLFQAKDVKVEWHVATPQEIDFTLELLRELVVPALDSLDSLLDQAQEEKGRSKEWTNDFCRVSLFVTFSALTSQAYPDAEVTVLQRRPICSRRYLFLGSLRSTSRTWSRSK